MGRKKIVIRRINDIKKRSTTYMKRKKGLLKKAMELSILCGCDVSVIISGEDDIVYSSQGLEAAVSQIATKPNVGTYTNKHYEELFGGEVADSDSVESIGRDSPSKRRKLDEIEPNMPQGLIPQNIGSDYNSTVSSLQSLAYQQASMIQALMHQQATLLSQMNVNYENSNMNMHDVGSKELTPSEVLSEGQVENNDINYSEKSTEKALSGPLESNTNRIMDPKQSAHKEKKETETKKPSLKISIPTTPTIFSIPPHLKSSTAPNFISSLMSPNHFNSQLTPNSTSSSDSNSEWLNNFISSPHLQFQNANLTTPTLFPNYPNFLQSPKM